MGIMGWPLSLPAEALSGCPILHFPFSILQSPIPIPDSRFPIS